MPVHPIEFRYFYPEMKKVFTEESRLQKWLDVEASLAWAHSQLGSIPAEAAEEIGRKADVGIVKLERVKEIERETRHDIMAMVVAFTEAYEGKAVDEFAKDSLITDALGDFISKNLVVLERREFEDYNAYTG
jgi:adenylosuccinate lyase